MSDSKYVHGYSTKENQRLIDQSGTLSDILHHDTRYSKGEKILEAGCGVGAQTIHLVGNSPEACFTCIDISSDSVEMAKQRITEAGLTNATFQQADLFNLPFEKNQFDHVFICFVLEHLSDPQLALKSLKRVVKPGGTLTVIEGDHGSTFFYPESEYAKKAIDCLNHLQRQPGGDPFIGRRLYPLLVESGFSEVCVSPRFIYADSSLPKMVEGFTKKTFAAMVEGVREDAIQAGLMDPESFDQGIADLYRAAEPDGVFCYTFFKARGVIGPDLP